MIRPIRRLAKLMLAACLPLALAACAGREDLSAPPADLGNFQLGYTIIVTSKMKQVGPSRAATGEEWQTLLKSEIVKRTGRYDGDKLYHLGINVDGFALAYPGIPLIVNPKSVLALSVNVWDDTAQRRINAEPKSITVFEPFTGQTVIGSGLTQSREEQMQNLAAAAARQINAWLVENKAWFTPEAVAARQLLPKQGGTGAAVPAASASSAAKAAAVATGGSTAAAAPAASKPSSAAASTATGAATTSGTAAKPAAAAAATTAPAATAAPAQTQRRRRGADATIPGIDRSVPNSVTIVPQATYP